MHVFFFIIIYVGMYLISRFYSNIIGRKLQCIGMNIYYYCFRYFHKPVGFAFKIIVNEMKSIHLWFDSRQNELNKSSLWINTGENQI